MKIWTVKVCCAQGSQVLIIRKLAVPSSLALLLIMLLDTPKSIITNSLTLKNLFITTSTEKYLASLHSQTPSLLTSKSHNLTSSFQGSQT